MKLNPKKVAFFHSHLFWIPHFETELELINKFQKSGSEVISYVCNAGLKKCDSNVNGSLKTCFQNSSETLLVWVWAHSFDGYLQKP